MLIHGPCLGRQKQNIDSARSTNEKSMGVRSSSALWQRQGTGGRALVSQLTPSWGLSLGGSGQRRISWTAAKTNQTSRKLAENKIERRTFGFQLRQTLSYEDPSTKVPGAQWNKVRGNLLFLFFKIITFLLRNYILEGL